MKYEAVRNIYNCIIQKKSVLQKSEKKNRQLYNMIETILIKVSIKKNSLKEIPECKNI